MNVSSIFYYDMKLRSTYIHVCAFSLKFEIWHKVYFIESFSFVEVLGTCDLWRKYILRIFERCMYVSNRKVNLDYKMTHWVFYVHVYHAGKFLFNIVKLLFLYFTWANYIYHGDLCPNTMTNYKMLYFYNQIWNTLFL